MNRILETLQLKETGKLSNRMIARLTKQSPTTVGRYWKFYKKHNFRLEALARLTFEELDAVFNPPRQPSPDLRQPDYAFHFRMMKKPDETLLRQWNLYREDGIPRKIPKPKIKDRVIGYSQFCANYRKFAVKLDLSMRQTHRAGECIFVDFCGRTIPWTDAATGKVHHAQVFVAVMGCSTYTLFHAVPAQTLAHWIDLHVWLFGELGAVPHIVTPDNLRAAVTKAGREPVINRTYLDLANHYGTIIVPARPGKPKDKAKVENGVRFVRRSVLAVLANRTFFSIYEINQAFDDLAKVINTRPFRRLPGCRQSWFEEMDKPAMKALPAEPFQMVEWSASQKVPKDFHIRVGHHFYSVPCTLPGSYVETKVSAKTVEIFQGGKLVAKHPRSDVVGGQSTLLEHEPPSHRHYRGYTQARFLEWAQGIGPSTLMAVQYQFDHKPHVMLALRAAATLRNLAKGYGPDKLELACRHGEKIGSLTLKSITSILKSRIYLQNEEDMPIVSPTPHHQNVRGADYYSRSRP